LGQYSLKMTTHEYQKISYTWTVESFSFMASRKTCSPTFPNNSGDLRLQLELYLSDLYDMTVRLKSLNKFKYAGNLKIWIQGNSNVKGHTHFTMPDCFPEISLMRFDEFCEELQNYLIDGKLIIRCVIERICGQCDNMIKDPSCNDLGDLAYDLGALLDTKKLADVTIVTGDDHKIPAHKLILSGKKYILYIKNKA